MEACKGAWTGSSGHPAKFCAWTGHLVPRRRNICRLHEGKHPAEDHLALSAIRCKSSVMPVFPFDMQSAGLGWLAQIALTRANAVTGHCRREASGRHAAHLRCAGCRSGSHTGSRNPERLWPVHCISACPCHSHLGLHPPPSKSHPQLETVYLRHRTCHVLSIQKSTGIYVGVLSAALGPSMLFLR